MGSALYIQQQPPQTLPHLLPNRHKIDNVAQTCFENSFTYLFPENDTSPRVAESCMQYFPCCFKSGQKATKQIANCLEENLASCELYFCEKLWYYIKSTCQHITKQNKGPTKILIGFKEIVTVFIQVFKLKLTFH